MCVYRFWYTITAVALGNFAKGCRFYNSLNTGSEYIVVRAADPNLLPLLVLIKYTRSMIHHHINGSGKTYVTLAEML